jgi:hypothetical protein
MADVLPPHKTGWRDRRSKWSGIGSNRLGLDRMLRDMKKHLFKIIVTVVLLLFGLFYVFTQTDLTYRYRITVVFDTPIGEKSGNSVHQVQLRDGRGGKGLVGSLGGLGIWVTMEAVFVDLGSGKNAVMLLYGDPSDGETMMLRVAPGVVGHSLWGPIPPFAAAIREAQTKQAALVVPRVLAPTIITFLDITKPETAKVLFASKQDDVRLRVGGPPWGDRSLDVDRVREVLGPGYAFREARIEFVSAGFWPINMLPLPTPEFLFGTPLTNIHEDRLRWWGDNNRPALKAAESANLKGSAREDMFYIDR